MIRATTPIHTFLFDEDRQMQICMVIDAKVGGLIAVEKIGDVADLPDPEPEIDNEE